MFTWLSSHGASECGGPCGVWLSVHSTKAVLQASPRLNSKSQVYWDILSFSHLGKRAVEGPNGPEILFLCSGVSDSSTQGLEGEGSAAQLSKVKTGPRKCLWRETFCGLRQTGRWKREGCKELRGSRRQDLRPCYLLHSGSHEYWQVH